jgi:branched-chain amino acid transport system ATP-binding protein
MLKVVNIEVIYKDVIHALKGISFAVPDGKVVALLGANGAGKTTTLRAISGILVSQEGEISHGFIEFEGERISRMPAERICQMGISQIPESAGVFIDISVKENLLIGGFHRKDKQALNQDFQKILDLFPPLRGRMNLMAGYLSGGEQQMLAIGRALLQKPKLIMCDEPSLGLAPMLVNEIFGVIANINKDDGISILLIEQNATKAFEIARYAYIMETGKMVIDGTVEEVSQDKEVQEWYLGISGEDKKRRYADVKHYKRRKRWLS